MTTIIKVMEELLGQSVKLAKPLEKGYLDNLKNSDMNLAWKTNLALCSGFPRIDLSILQGLNSEIYKSTRYITKSNFLGVNRSVRNSYTKDDRIRIYKLEEWFNQVSEPIPKNVLQRTEEAKALNIFNKFYVLSASTSPAENLVKDPMIIATFDEARLPNNRSYEIIDWHDNRDVEDNSYCHVAHRLHHAIAWWGHDIDVTKFGLI